ncbi:MAG: copper chaperone CopZ [Verrucomicrobiales bacterium]|jgi:copper chaperone CopZ
MKTLISSLLAALMLSGLAFGESRNWTQAATGRKIPAELVSVKDDKVVLKLGNGQTAEVPISSLIEADQAFIAESQKAKPGDSPEPTASAADMKIPEGPTELILAEAHACCKGCYTAIEKAAESLSDVTVSASKGKITIKGDTGSLVEAALGYVKQAGFYGKPSIAAFADTKKYATTEIEEIYLSRVHVCCRSCVRDLEGALESVEGIKEFTEIEDGISEVHITGKFTQAQVMAALHAGGMHGALSPRSRN